MPDLTVEQLLLLQTGKVGDGTAEIAKSQYSNPMLKLSGDVAMTQELTDLKNRVSSMQYS